MAMPRPAGFRYPRAPIVEAVYDVQTAMPAGFDLERLGLLGDPGYHLVDATANVEAVVEAGPIAVATKTHRRVSGYRYASQDERQIVLMRDHGFTFSRLAPYDCWATFSAEAARLWQRYHELAQPMAATRLGLRYINQIVPRTDTDVVELSDYLRTRPEISDDMPNLTVGYFLSIDIPLPEFDAGCRITQTIVPRDLGGKAIVLDIDTYAERTYDPADSAGIEATFARLREAKNTVFEASITEEARRLFY
jgi:uncharacterized protein (TIGR04255 family)